MTRQTDAPAHLPNRIDSREPFDSLHLSSSEDLPAPQLPSCFVICVNDDALNQSVQAVLSAELPDVPQTMTTRNALAKTVRALVDGLKEDATVGVILGSAHGFVTSDLDGVSVSNALSSVLNQQARGRAISLVCIQDEANSSKIPNEPQIVINQPYRFVHAQRLKQGGLDEVSLASDLMDVLLEQSFQRVQAHQQSFARLVGDVLPLLEEGVFCSLGLMYQQRLWRGEASAVHRLVDAQGKYWLLKTWLNTAVGAQAFYNEYAAEQRLNRFLNQSHGALFAHQDAAGFALLRPFIDGVSLDTTLNDNDVPNAHKQSLVHQAKQALIELHKQGVLHGDVKPVNAIVGAERIFWVDFELSRVFQANNTSESMEYMNADLTAFCTTMIV